MRPLPLPSTRRAVAASAVAAAAFLWSAATLRAQPLVATSPASIGLSTSALDRITPALQAYIDSGRVAGLVALVVRHGRVGYLRALGRMDVERDIPMRTDAVFRIFSMTKPIVAVAALKLHDQGLLRLDDPVSRYIPAFAGTRVYAGGGARQPALREPERPMTVRHLLTHTAGLTYGAFGSTPVDTIYRGANLLPASRTNAQFADSIAQLPLAFAPGSAWAYSMSIDVLGRVVEVVSGLPLDQYLEREVFAPLGMRETAFRARADMEGRIPVLYSPLASGGIRAAAQLLAANYRPDARILSGGGGLLSTPADYLRFARMLLNGGEVDGVRILKRESVVMMMSNQLPPELTPIRSPLVGFDGYGHGLGGVVLVDSARAGGGASPGTYRWWGYAGTFFWIDPKADLIGMIWTQLLPGRTYPLEQDFQRLVYQAIAQP